MLGKIPLRSFHLGKILWGSTSNIFISSFIPSFTKQCCLLMITLDPPTTPKNEEKFLSYYENKLLVGGMKCFMTTSFQTSRNYENKLLVGGTKCFMTTSFQTSRNYENELLVGGTKCFMTTLFQTSRNYLIMKINY